jgi:hypothetical protein
MAAHGVSRATADIDLMATDARVLSAARWPETAAAAPFATAPIRPGGGVSAAQAAQLLVAAAQLAVARGE